MLTKLLLALLVLEHVRPFGSDAPGSDVYYSWVEGKRLLVGENPYARVLSGDMRTNEKYATYFPLFYLASAAVQAAGFADFGSWIAFFRVVFALFDAAIVAVLFWTLWRRGLELLAVFACFFWAASRWHLIEISIGQLDFIPIFFLLLSLALLPRRPTLAYLCFGASLATKQIAIFLLPLYLVWAWQDAEEEPSRAAVRAALWIAAIPAVLSLPFLVWNAEGYLRSLLFSATRAPASHFEAQSLDAYFHLDGFGGRLPMLALQLLVYACAARGLVGRYTAVLLSLSVFVDLNTVLYVHYPCWVVPFVPLVACDRVDALAARAGPAHA